MVRELAQQLSSGVATGVCECKSHWIRAATRDDDLVQQMMAVMGECARERGARYEIPWLNVVVERRPSRR